MFHKKSLSHIAVLMLGLSLPGQTAAQGSTELKPPVPAAKPQAAATTAEPVAETAPGQGQAPAAPPPAPWGTQCSGEDRTKALDCRLDQRVVLSTTGQLLTAVTVRLSPDGTEPVMMIQTPFGLFLPAGLRLAVDGAEVTTLPLQTCDAGGCYAGSTVSAELLAAMQRGATLTVTFQDVQKNDIAVPVSLLGFSEAYSRIR